MTDDPLTHEIDGQQICDWRADIGGVCRWCRGFVVFGNSPPKPCMVHWLAYCAFPQRPHAADGKA